MTGTGMLDGVTAMPADLRAALDRLDAALRAIFLGDPAPYAALWAPGEQPTLFGAFGTVERGHDAVTRTFTWVAARFTDGHGCAARREVVDWSGDLAYTVGFEEGEIRVDGGPPRWMTIRVTHVLKRIDGEWRLVHRHGDHPPPDPRHST